MRLCLEEMALGLPGEAAQAQAEVWVEVVRVGVEWGVTALGLALVAVASALTVVPGYPIK